MRISMERILIIGSNGAGKSTFSYRLASALELPLIHIDQIYWRGSWEVMPREEFEKAVLLEAQKPQWIIEGNNIGSLYQRLPYADAVIWFEFSPLLCVWNILKREFKYRNQVRPDMPDDCISCLSLKFLKEVWYFNRKNHERIEKQLREANIQPVHFTNYRQVEEFLENLGGETNGI